jgi:ferredoxin
MDGQYLFVARLKSHCADCGFCRSLLYCPAPQTCIGCRVCVAGCPYEARELVPDPGSRPTYKITIDDRALSVPESITVKRARLLSRLPAAKPSPSPSRGDAGGATDLGRRGVIHGRSTNGDGARRAGLRGCLIERVNMGQSHPPAGCTSFRMKFRGHEFGRFLSIPASSLREDCPTLV